MPPANLRPASSARPPRPRFPLLPAPRARLASAVLTCVAIVAASADAQAPAARAPGPAVPALTNGADPASFASMRWRMLGPARGGRVTTVAGVPSQPHTFYMGSTGGGIWRTTDAGMSWVNISDGQLPVGSMGDIRVADSDPRIIYAGTGSDGLRSNVSIGKGVFKSTDAGATWKFVGLADVGNIGAVRIHPANPDVAFVAAIGNPFAPGNARGLYRTTNGGASWERVLYVSDSTGAVDVEFMPGNPQVLYASMWRGERKPWTIISGAREGGIYKSTDGGTTWTKLGNGLPSGLVGKSNIATTAANPQRVYVLIEAKPGGGLYRSDDAGASFTQVSSFGQLITRPFYYTTITAHPTNPDEVYVGSEGYWKSVDGGRTFRSQRVPHGDNHDLWINPLHPEIMIESNDGGATVTLDAMKTWSTLYNQPTAEIYQVYVDRAYPYRLYGAQQDNTTLIVPSLPETQAGVDDAMQLWRQGPGCETGPIMPHPVNRDTVYGSCKGQFSRLNLHTGQEKQYWIGAQSLYGNAGKDLVYRFQRVSPFEVSPHDPRTIYYGSQYVHRTRDEGVTWETISPDLTWNPPERQQDPSGTPITLDGTGEETYSTLYAIRESVLDPNVIWTGANDGPFHVTRDGGKHWTDITPKGLGAGGRVQNIEPSPHRKGSAYYTVLRYQLGDFKPYAYRTDDYGAHWTLLTDGSNGIPADHPVRVVREDPEREGLLYAGTEFGAFVSFDNGAHWQALQLNLPATPITDAKVTQGDLAISTQGRGFWILDNLSVLRQQADAIAGKAVHLYRPRVATRTRYATRQGGADSQEDGGGLGQTRPSDPEFPPPGAQIDYVLKASGPVELTIADAAGTVLRRFSSDGLGQRAVEPAEPSMRAPAMAIVGTPRLPKKAGHNRFTWDMTLPGPWTADSLRSGRNGPAVLPGRYTVTVSAGGVSESQPLEIRLDPRLGPDGVTPRVLAEQLEHNLRTRDLVSEVNRLAASVTSDLRRLAADSSASGLARRKELETLRAQLVTPPIRYSKPELQAHIQYLYSLSMQADQQVSGDAKARYKELRATLDKLARKKPIA
ncbi:MAG: hypothetical protein HY275_18175 [Gemmatimonadetes bacterium]|nr:hypothetical protein [Gemmatimonadota bacterium]